MRDASCTGLPLLEQSRMTLLLTPPKTPSRISAQFPSRITYSLVMMAAAPPSSSSSSAISATADAAEEPRGCRILSSKLCFDVPTTKVSPGGVTIRDEKVFKFAQALQNIPLLMLTSGGYMKSSARVIADSIINLPKKNLIDLPPQ